MRNHLLKITCLFFFTILLAPGCGDNVTGVSDGRLVGRWIYDSSLVAGKEMFPPDTLVHRGNRTGELISGIGWGAYEFTFTVADDTIFYVRTAGQDAGYTDTVLYEIRSDSLFRNRYSGGEYHLSLWIKE